MSEAPEAWTVTKVLRFAQADFQKRDFDSPRLDAELLLGACLGLSRVELLMEAARPLSPSELGAYRELIQRRRKGEPIAYILGRREFHGLDFRVDSRVLVPRPDTEVLVEVALTRTRARDQFGEALDLCTGSGCVAIAFRSARPGWRVMGVDVSRDALRVAQENALRLGCVFGMCWREGDLYDAVPAPQRFDLITANPPYIPSQELAELAPDVRDFEPRLALDGGPDGLDVIRRVVAQAGGRLRSGGVLALEVHYDQAPRVEQLLKDSGFTETSRSRDYGGHERVVSGRRAD
ncbi:MAG: peptide chain release factor N(5)-glutamine methyltransferase [Polyangiaceae bacterium]|nr:peptide chain release factor N(5)-glutamine methyltransferase [Polyangiaceae bacterium]MCW5792377.1 peptide chain release factor N(5)-glutamine methyltransferase [Polyangiaceae bacterium]